MRQPLLTLDGTGTIGGIFLSVHHGVPAIFGAAMPMQPLQRYGFARFYIGIIITFDRRIVKYKFGR